MEITIENVFEELLLIKKDEEVSKKNSNFVITNKNKKLDNSTVQITFGKLADPFFKDESAKQMYTSLFDIIISDIEEDDDFFNLQNSLNEEEDEDEELAKDAYKKLNVKKIIKDKLKKKIHKKLNKAKRLRKWFDNLKKNIEKKDPRKHSKGKLKRLGRKFSTRVGKFIKNAKNNLKRLLRSVGNYVKRFLSNSFKRMKTMFNFFKNLKQSVTKKGSKDRFSFVRNILNKLSKLFKRLINFVEKGIKKVFGVIKNIFKNLIKHIKPAFNIIGKFFAIGLKKIVWGFFKLLIKMIPKLVVAVASATAGVVTFGASWAVTALNIAWIIVDITTFCSDVAPVLAGIPETLENFENSINDGIDKFSNSMKERGSYFNKAKDEDEQLEAIDILGSENVDERLKSLNFTKNLKTAKNFKMKMISLDQHSYDMDYYLFESEVVSVMEEIQSEFLPKINPEDYDEDSDLELAQENKKKGINFAIETMRESMMFKDDIFTVLVSGFDWLIVELDDTINLFKFENVIKYNQTLSNLFNLGFVDIKVEKKIDVYEDYKGIEDIEKDTSIKDDLKIELKAPILTDVIANEVKENFKKRREMESEKLKCLIGLVQAVNSEYNFK